MCAQKWRRVDAAPAKWPAPGNASDYPPYTPKRPSYLGQYGLERGCAERDAPCGRGCVSFRWLLTPLSFLQLFPKIILRLATRTDFVTGLAATAVFFNFFHPKSNVVKTKSEGDQKLGENACRIFKPFLARFPIHGCLKVWNSETAASPEPGEKKLKNATRVIY